MNIFLTVSEGILAHSHSKSLQITEDETSAGPLSGSYVSLFVEKKKTLFLCHVCFGSASQIYLCRTFQQQCSPCLFSATNFRRLCKTNTTGVLESLIFVTESTETFLLQAIIVYKYQIRQKRQFVNSLSVKLLRL